MAQEIQTIVLGSTNCYLVKAGSSQMLIDTGFPFQRSQLEDELEKLGCRPASLKLVVATHGDIDHTGNCAYLCEQYGVRIAMHEGDTEMCMKDGITRERGKVPEDFPLPLMIVWLAKGFLAFGLGQLAWRKPFESFEPDLLLEEGQSLEAFGFDGEILHTPGHSKGSISVLFGDGNLICGDAFSNAWGRFINSTGQSGLERLRALGVKTLYPGHGKPFSMARLVNGRQPKRPARADMSQA